MQPPYRVHSLITMMLLAGVLLAIAVAVVVWVVRAVARRHHRHDLGAVSAQWLMANRIQR